MKWFNVYSISLSALLMGGCGVYHRHGLEADRLRRAEAAFAGPRPALDSALESRILALDPENVSAADIRDALSHAPAPRIVNIHGGIAWVIPRMVSFSEFLIGMGYPAQSITNPADGTYSFSCYESSKRIAGAIAWYYEKEGLRPMMVGHSQGGMQVVKVLYKLQNSCPDQLAVWNPLTARFEDRCEIRDPLTGRMRPVAGPHVAFASPVGAGGLTRILPNQWDMFGRLHSVPDTVEEFTGFCKGMDLFGGDWLGYGSGNEYKPLGKAVVRNVWLPTSYHHGHVPDTRHLLKDPQIVEFLNAYRPAPGAVTTPVLEKQLTGDSANILWAAEIWYDIKKHWVLELQRWIRSRHS